MNEIQSPYGEAADDVAVSPAGEPLVRSCCASLVPLLAFATAFAGFFAAAVLSIGHILDIPVPCGASRGCTAVASHPGSKLLGMPIAYIGVAGYVLILITLARSTASPLARRGLLALAAFGAIASAYLLCYAHITIRAACPWCIGSGAAMAILLVLSIVIVRRGERIAPVRSWIVWIMAMLTAIAIGLQAGAMKRAADAPPIKPERLATFTIAELTAGSKVKGDRDAPLTIVVFSDPWCPACAAVHKALTEYQQGRPDAVRVVYRHLPLWEISGATAALSEIAAEHEQFWPFIDAVYARAVQPTREGYLRIMNQLGIATDDLEARIADVDDPAVRRVWEDVVLADRLGVTATPTFIVAIRGLPPMSANQRTLERMLNSHLVVELVGRSGAAEPDVVE